MMVMAKNIFFPLLDTFYINYWMNELLNYFVKEWPFFWMIAYFWLKTPNLRLTTLLKLPFPFTYYSGCNTVTHHVGCRTAHIQQRINTD